MRSFVRAALLACIATTALAFSAGTAAAADVGPLLGNWEPDSAPEFDLKINSDGTATHTAGRVGCLQTVPSLFMRNFERTNATTWTAERRVCDVWHDTTFVLGANGTLTETFDTGQVEPWHRSGPLKPLLGNWEPDSAPGFNLKIDPDDGTATHTAGLVGCLKAVPSLFMRNFERVSENHWTAERRICDTWHDTEFVMNGDGTLTETFDTGQVEPWHRADGLTPIAGHWEPQSGTSFDLRIDAAGTALHTGGQIGCLQTLPSLFMRNFERVSENRWTAERRVCDVWHDTSFVLNDNGTLTETFDTGQVEPWYRPTAIKPLLGSWETDEQPSFEIAFAADGTANHNAGTNACLDSALFVRNVIVDGEDRWTAERRICDVWHDTEFVMNDDGTLTETIDNGYVSTWRRPHPLKPILGKWVPDEAPTFEVTIASDGTATHNAGTNACLDSSAFMRNIKRTSANHWSGERRICGVWHNTQFVLASGVLTETIDNGYVAVWRRPPA